MTSPIRTYRFLTMLTCLGSMFLIAGLVLQNYLTDLESILVFSATIYIFPFVGITLDIISELYDYTESRKSLWTIVGCHLGFALIIYFAMKLQGPPYWSTYLNEFHKTFESILKNASIASIAVLIGQWCNILLISKLRKLTSGKYFALRSIASGIVGETVTVILALSFMFSSSLNTAQLFKLIGSELAVMYFLNIVLAILGTGVLFFLKMYEYKADKDSIIKDNFKVKN